MEHRTHTRSVSKAEVRAYTAGFDVNALAEGAKALGIPLTEEQLQAFARYYGLLRAWNERINLTSIVEPEAVIRKHFLDALAPLPVLAEEVARVDEESGRFPAVEPMPHLLSQKWRAIDVGAGAGIPGLPVKIVWTALRLTLLDATLKKVRFMNEVIRWLGLRQTVAIQGRAETFGRDPAFREQFDVVMARGLAPMNTLAEYTLPFARLNGWVLLYKGPRGPQELADAFGAIDTLGGYVERVAPLHIPGLDERRFAILIRKVRRTPRPFPRERGLPRRRPLQ